MGGLEHDPTTYDRDHLGRGIKYFHANIGTSNAISSKLWGLRVFA